METKVNPLTAPAMTARHKHFLRGFHRETLRALPAAARRKGALETARFLAQLPVFQDAQTVGLTVSVNEEMDSKPFFDLCRRFRKAMAVPVIFPEAFRMEFSFVDAATRWTRNVYGIPEPHPDHWRLIDARNVELLLMPGRAFTPEGVRLGMGGGYYDRFLARHPGMSTVGLAFDCQVEGRLPASPEDARVDWLVTPTRTFSCR